MTHASLDELFDQRGVLAVGHPGHELRIHGWLERARPEVLVITDGSGRTGRSRIPSTAAVLSNAGCRQGALFGICSDHELYDTLMTGSLDLPMRIVEHFRTAVADADYVVGDALEGFNPTHDLCRYLLNLSVELAGKARSRPLANFDFVLDGSPSALSQTAQEPLRYELDDASLARKLAAARAYSELTHETEAALARFGEDAFRVELLRPVTDARDGVQALSIEPPYYETYGERQVALGHYASVVRFREHVRPLVARVWEAWGCDPFAERPQFVAGA